MIEKQLAEILTDDAAITALVGERVTPVVVVVDAGFPSLSYRRLSANREYALDGSIKRITALIQITAWALTYDGAKTLAEAITACLDVYTDDTTVGGIRLASVNDAEDEYADAINAYGCNLVVTVVSDGG